MNPQPNWLPTVPTDLAVAEAAFGAGPVRAMINDGMVDVHWLDDGSAVLDWSDLHTAARIWRRWGTKRKDARLAAVAVLTHAEWLASLLAEHEEQVRAQVRAEAKIARCTAIQRTVLASIDAGTVRADSQQSTVSFEELLADAGEAE